MKRTWSVWYFIDINESDNTQTSRVISTWAKIEICRHIVNDIVHFINNTIQDSQIY